MSGWQWSIFPIIHRSRGPTRVIPLALLPRLGRPLGEIRWRKIRKSHDAPERHPYVVDLDRGCPFTCGNASSRDWRRLRHHHHPHDLHILTCSRPGALWMGFVEIPLFPPSFSSVHNPFTSSFKRAPYPHVLALWAPLSAYYGKDSESFSRVSLACYSECSKALIACTGHERTLALS